MVKEPVVRLIKVVSGHWEKSLEDELSKFDWDRIIGNLIRLMRVAIFQSAQGENFEFETNQTKTVLKEAILELMPGKNCLSLDMLINYTLTTTNSTYC